MASYDPVVRDTAASAGHPVSRVSWRSILAGAIVSIAVSWLLMALGGAVGLSAIEPQQNQWGSLAGAAATGLWGILSIGIGSFIGAWAASRASAIADSTAAALQGLTVWSIGFVTAAFFAAFLGAAAGQVSSTAANAADDVEAAGGNSQADEAAISETQAAEAAVDSSAAFLWYTFLSGALGMIGGIAGGIAGMRRTGQPHLPTDDRSRVFRPTETIP